MFLFDHHWNYLIVRKKNLLVLETFPIQLFISNVIYNNYSTTRILSHSIFFWFNKTQKQFYLLIYHSLMELLSISFFVILLKYSAEAEIIIINIFKYVKNSQAHNIFKKKTKIVPKLFIFILIDIASILNLSMIKVDILFNLLSSLS